MNPTITPKLIERCTAREQSAQMELYSILFRGVYSSALRIVGDRESAQEITQDAFLKLFDNIERYRDRTAATVRRIAINASIDLLRKRRVNFVEFSSQSDIAQQEEEEDIAFTEANVDAIKRAISELPTGYRLAITLRLIEDLSFEEIAQEMGIAPSSARSQFIRAKRRLIEIIRMR